MGGILDAWLNQDRISATCKSNETSAEAVLVGPIPISITSCARLPTLMSPAGFVTYLGLTPGILGAAGNLGTHLPTTTNKLPMTQQRVIAHKEA